MDIPDTIFDKGLCVQSQSVNVSRCTLPFSISAIRTDEAFQVPRLRGRCNLPHQLLVDLDTQPRSLQSLDETVLDSESFWVCDVAVDVVLTSCVERRNLVSRMPRAALGWNILPSTL